MFSKRLRYSLEESELWRLLSVKRAAGDDVIDLTESNPTRVGLDYPDDAILAAVSRPEISTYDPAPAGIAEARRAIATYYRDHGKSVSPDDVVVTASTSEAYSFLFKLLGNPGDEVLVPRPSYPLHEFLASLDAVVPVPYAVDFGVAEPLPSRCRAIVSVHPNNPTGSYVPRSQRERLLELAETRDVALIVDEVFLDYRLDAVEEPESFAGDDARALVFVVSGLSKLAGLPQLKLAWIVVGGAAQRRREAVDRLTHIADTYLSVGTPVQHATRTLVELAPGIRASIQRRLEQNLAILNEDVPSVPEVSCSTPEGGWYAVLRLPAILSSERWALDFLNQASVYLHPGHLFGYERGAHSIVSLLPSPDRFRDALRRVLRVVSDRVNSRGA